MGNIKYFSSTITATEKMSCDDKISFLTDLVRKLRGELLPIRNKLGREEKSHRHWKDKSTILQNEISDLKKTNKVLEKEVAKINKIKRELEEEIVKISKTNNRYASALFGSGNNSKHSNKNKKKKGGQKGHADTNRESRQDTGGYARKRISLESCPHCQLGLGRTDGLREKLLIDIKLNPEIIKTIIESERQWCGNCKKEVSAKDHSSLPFTEYGINIFMIVLLLRCKSGLTFKKIADVLSLLCGVSVAKSGVSNILKSASVYLESRYDALLTAVRAGEIMYNDETGWSVHGQSAWMWIAASDKENITVYKAAESRGGGIFKDLYGASSAFSMHDGYAGYNSPLDQSKNLFCWAHVLRFGHEETFDLPPGSPSKVLCQLLVETYNLIKSGDPPSEIEMKARNNLNQVLNSSCVDASSMAIKGRIEKQKDGLIRALVLTPDGTNNLSERELRPLVINRKVSFGSDTYAGMEATAINTSVVQTIHRQGLPFKETLLNYLRNGVTLKNPTHFFVNS